MSRIVVGVDGSERAAEAFRWALEEARLRDAEVQVVYAYESTPPWRFYPDEDGLAGAQYEAISENLERTAEEARAHAERVIAELVAAAEADVGTLPPIERVAVEHHRPAEVLIDRGGDADMIVVGSRGRGGFKGLLLGSVSHQVATHATCPVVILGHRVEQATERPD